MDSAEHVECGIHCFEKRLFSSTALSIPNSQKVRLHINYVLTGVKAIEEKFYVLARGVTHPRISFVFNTTPPTTIILRSIKFSDPLPSRIFIEDVPDETSAAI